MFIDMHCHTSGISKCCRADYIKILDTAKDAGYDALVITNHYSKSYFTDENYNDWIEKYIDEWNKCCIYGEGIGIRIFHGIELTYENNPEIHFLIYGVDEDFLRNNKFLCNKSHEEIYKICHENNAVLVQAHPFRNETRLMDTNLLDGIEINCRIDEVNTHTSAETVLIAKNNNLAITVGCDYHANTHRQIKGMHIPDNIETDKNLADYLTYKKIHKPDLLIGLMYEHSKIRI